MNRTRLLAGLSLMGLLFAGCSTEPRRSAGITAPDVPTISTLPTAYLTFNDLEYEVFSGTLAPGEGGVMYGTMATWGKNCNVALIVPPEAMDPEGPPVNFTMSLPTKASYLAYPEELYQRLIVRLGPDGESFLAPITVQVTWMPWQGAPPDPLVVMSGGVVEATPTVQYLPATNRYRITYQVSHFSDWEVTKEPPGQQQ